MDDSALAFRLTRQMAASVDDRLRSDGEDAFDRACTKLGVVVRTAAVTKAIEIGALPPPGQPAQD